MLVFPLKIEIRKKKRNPKMKTRNKQTVVCYSTKRSKKVIVLHTCLLHTSWSIIHIIKYFLAFQNI